MGKVKTGNPTDYTSADEAALEAAAEAAWQNYDTGDDGGDPSELYVEADVEWAGTYNPRPHRATRLDGLNLAGVRQALRTVRAAKAGLAGAQPLRSYGAKGWHAQLTTLTRTARGSAAADAAGLTVTRRTLLGWLSEQHTPTAANQAKIAAAYASVRDRPVTEARGQLAAARAQLAAEITAALRERYGAEIRLFNITRFNLN